MCKEICCGNMMPSRMSMVVRYLRSQALSISDLQKCKVMFPCAPFTAHTAPMHKARKAGCMKDRGQMTGGEQSLELD